MGNTICFTMWRALGGLRSAAVDLQAVSLRTRCPIAVPAARAFTSDPVAPIPPVGKGVPKVVEALPEGRFYPAWVDDILNRKHATGKRGLRQKKRMRLRQLQRERNHRLRIKQTAASLKRKAEKLQEQKELADSFGMKLEGVGAHKQWKLTPSTFVEIPTVGNRAQRRLTLQREGRHGPLKIVDQVSA